MTRLAFLALPLLAACAELPTAAPQFIEVGCAAGPIVMPQLSAQIAAACAMAHEADATVLVEVAQ